MTATTRRSSHAAGARIEKSGPRNQSRGRPFVRGTTASPRAPRGRGRGRYRTPVANRRAQFAQQALEDESLAETDQLRNHAPATTNIARYWNGFSAAKPLWLYFVQRGRLENSPDAETIALNLIDFMLIEHHWDCRLRFNVLASSCFLFASSLTGLSNQASDIAKSFGPDLEIHTQMWITSLVTRGIPFADSATVKSMMRLRAEDVEDGYAILWNIRHAFQELVGGYAEGLEAMPMPTGYSEMFENGTPEEVEQEAVEHEEEQDGLPEVEHKEELATFDSLVAPECGVLHRSTSMAEPEKSEMIAEHILGVAMAQEPELVELDDFETSIEEYES